MASKLYGVNATIIIFVVVVYCIVFLNFRTIVTGFYLHHSTEQMLRKSVETRDCLGSIEPRSVKSVMKRVVEDITTVEKFICQAGVF